MGNFGIVAVCASGAQNKCVLTKIKKWCQDNRHLNLLRSIEVKIEEVNDLRAGLEKFNQKASSDIKLFLTIGFPRQELFLDPERQVPQKCEVLHLNTTSQRPSASLLGPRISIQSISEPALVLRKAIIRNRVRENFRLRLLYECSDFESYFELRYRVWVEMGYLSRNRNGGPRMELNYSDRYALPVGIFTNKNKLVACARLVYPFGRQTLELGRCKETIEKLLNNEKIKALLPKFRNKAGMQYPFDVFDSFEGFHDYYSELVKKKLVRAEVSRVIVDPGYRGKYLGEVMVDSVTALAKSKGIKVTFLACKEEHRTFYENSGFKLIESLNCEKFVGVNVPAIAMERVS